MSESKGIHDDLRRLLRAITIHSPMQYELDGKTYRVAPFGAGQSPMWTAWSAGQPPLVIDLQTHIYDQAYCRPLGSRIDPPAQSAPIIDALSAANAGRDRWEAGWTLVQLLQNGHAMARKNEFDSTFAPGEFVTANGAPPSPGTPLNVLFARESRTQQPGFYIANGETPAPSGSESRMTRIYWHIAEEGAVPLTRIITTLLNRYQVPFRFKTLSYSGVYTRSDSAVLYFAARYYQIVSRVLPAIRARSANAPQARHAAADARTARRNRIGRGSRERGEFRDESEPSDRAGDLGRLRARHADRRRAHGGAGHPVSADRTLARSPAPPRRQRRHLRGRGMSALPQLAPTADPRERFLDVAWSIGMRLCRDAIWDGDRCNWLGDSMEAHGGEWKVAHKSFGAELYSGTSGIALFLARLHNLRPDPLLAQTARGAIAQALSHTDDLPPEMRHALYAGWIGIALALLDCAQLLDDRQFKRDALRLVDRQLGHELDPMSLDIIGGAAGAISGLCAIDRRLGSDRFLSEARRLGEHLLTHAHRADDGWSWTTMPSMGPAPQKDLAGYSHGAAGIALALLELHRRTNDARFLEGALGGFAYERACFSHEHHNWPDFRSFASPNPQQLGYSLAWCHGAPGIGLSRLRAFALTGDETYKQEAEAAIIGTYRPLMMPSAGRQLLALPRPRRQRGAVHHGRRRPRR